MTSCIQLLNWFMNWNILSTLLLNTGIILQLNRWIFILIHKLFPLINIHEHINNL